MILALLLAASPALGPADVQPLLKEGNADSWASVGYLGESADGRVALVIEQGESDAGHELWVTFLIADSSGKLPAEKITWSTTDSEQMDVTHAWEARGAQLHQALERANIKVGFKRFTKDKPKGLSIVYGDPSAVLPVKVKLGGNDWFETTPLDKPRLEHRGAVNTAKGALHLFLLQRLGNGAGPEFDFLARALPIS
jgi:hypothetical protein